MGHGGVVIEGVPRGQAGLISRKQALGGGLSAQQISRRLAAGRWMAVHPTVYLVADREYTDEVRLRAAGLWAGESATVSGLAAAWWLGLWTEPPTTVDVTVPGRRSFSVQIGRASCRERV